VASNDLVFEGLPLLTGDLVFGDDGSSPVTDAIISGAVTLAKPTLQGAVVLGIKIEGAATLTKPTLRGEVIYDTDTQRPLAAQITVRYQDTDSQPAAVEQRFQDAARARAHTESRFENATPAHAGYEIRWAEADRTKRASTEVRYQDGSKVRRGVRSAFQQAVRAPRVVQSRFENGVPASQGWEVRFQDGTKTPNTQRVRYQDADRLHRGVEQHNTNGRLLERGWGSRYQEGIQPRPGRTILVPVDPPAGEPCYTPDGDLVFEAPWSTDTNLVFVCEAHIPPEPGETIVVPVKRVYIVINTATLHLVDGHVPIPTYSMSMSLDVDSWTWSFSAAVPGAALPLVSPDGSGNRALVEAVLNGVAYRFLVTSRGRDRSFASDGLRIGGKGVGAELADPIAPIMAFGNTIDRTAQQLMGDVLSLNGVPLPDWTVDWQLEDWLVKAGAWKKQGTYIEALNEIVAAAGGYLQPHPTAKTLRALLRYPVAPWNWGDVTPDYELPLAAFTNEGIEWNEKPVYDRVYVSGQAGGGRLTNVRREGTAGELVAQMVTEPLNTDSIAGRQRGQAILSDTGKTNTYTLRGAAGIKDVEGVPVGIIPPGKFVRYVDPVEGPKIGITRSVNVDVRMPEIWQTITLETHEDV
jgi:hypothetical protein